MAKMIVDGKEVITDDGVDETVDVGMAPAQTEVGTAEQPAQGQMFPDIAYDAGEGEEPAMAPQAPASGAPQALIPGLAKPIATNDELVAYARELELKNVAAEAELKGVKAHVGQPMDKPPAYVAPPKDYSTLIFEDPNKAISEIQNDVLARIQAEAAAQREIQEHWNDFYRRNPNLVGKEAFVQGQFAVNTPNYVGKTVEQIKVELAESCSKLLGQLTKSNMPVETLASGRAALAPSTRIPAPVVHTPAAQPQNFVSQLKALRKRPASR